MTHLLKQPSICTRREFLEKSVKGIGAVALGSFVVTFANSCSSDSNPTEPTDNNGNGDATLTVDLTQQANQALATVGGTLALGSNVIDSKGILLYRETETVVKAYSRECTHQQCTIGAFNSSGISTCPCHGSQFNTSGNVANGPASNSLRRYNASLEGNIITITR